MDKYLRVCEQLGEEPDPKKMPPDRSDFPEEVQVAFFVSGYLEDKWEGMSGTYMGKVWTNIEYLFKLFEVQDPVIVLYFMNILYTVIEAEKAEKAEKERKAEERRSSSGGKNFTHNVTG